MFGRWIQKFKEFTPTIVRPCVELAKAHPMKTTALLSIVFAPVTDRCLRARAINGLNNPVLEKMEIGSRPDVKVSCFMPRVEISTFIKSLYLDNKANGYAWFGLIVGPSGTGKTTIVRDLCERLPKGVLYHEARGFGREQFVQSLAEEVGMKIRPTSIFDLLLACISDNYACYHQLPRSVYGSLSLIMKTLGTAAQRYKQKHGRIPVLFIDGVDLLAEEKDLLISIIRHAKFLANHNKIIIVFVTSKEPSLEKGSVSTLFGEALNIVEVLDISDGEAMNFLAQKKITGTVASRIVELVGGRFADLMYSSDLVHCYEGLPEDDLLKKIEQHMFGLLLNHQKEVIAMAEPYSAKLLKMMSNEGCVSLSYFLGTVTAEDRLLAIESINKMVAAKVFRYNSKGMLTWDGKMPKTAFLTKD